MLIAKCIFVIFKIKVNMIAKKVVSLVSSGENIVLPLFAPLQKYCWPTPGKSTIGPSLEKNPSVTHVQGYMLIYRNAEGVHGKRKLGNPWFRSWQIFAKDFFSNFPKLSGNVFCATFASKFSPIKISKTFFDVTSKIGLHVFFCKPWAPFFEVKQRRAPILRGFSGMLPRFSADQNFWGCTCTPCSNTTVFISVSQVTSQFIKIDLKHSHCSFSSTQKVQNDFLKFSVIVFEVNIVDVQKQT